MIFDSNIIKLFAVLIFLKILCKLKLNGLFFDDTCENCEIKNVNNIEHMTESRKKVPNLIQHVYVNKYGLTREQYEMMFAQTDKNKYDNKKGKGKYEIEQKPYAIISKVAENAFPVVDKCESVDNRQYFLKNMNERKTKKMIDGMLYTDQQLKNEFN